MLLNLNSRFRRSRSKVTVIWRSWTTSLQTFCNKTTKVGYSRSQTNRSWSRLAISSIHRHRRILMTNSTQTLHRSNRRKLTNTWAQIYSRLKKTSPVKSPFHSNNVTLSRCSKSKTQEAPTTTISTSKKIEMTLISQDSNQSASSSR